MKISPRFASRCHLLHIRLLPVAFGFSACLAEEFPLIADSNRSRGWDQPVADAKRQPAYLLDRELSMDEYEARNARPNAPGGLPLLMRGKGRPPAELDAVCEGTRSIRLEHLGRRLAWWVMISAPDTRTMSASRR